MPGGEDIGGGGVWPTRADNPVLIWQPGQSLGQAGGGHIIGPAPNPTKIGPALPPQPQPPPDERPTCLAHAWNELTGAGNSAPHDEAAKTLAEGGSTAATAQAWRYAESRGLTYPLRSYIVRGWLNLGETFAVVGETIFPAFLAYEVTNAVTRTAVARYKGECRPPSSAFGNAFD
jgi:hypothetical protein